jgi:MbtH protein
MSGDSDAYIAILNHEEQYALWPSERPIPAGWRSVKEGTRIECLDYIEKVWTDMRPLQVRNRMRENR